MAKRIKHKRHMGHYSALLAVFTMLFMHFGIAFLPKTLIQDSALMNCPMHAMMAGELPLNQSQNTASEECSYCMLRTVSALECKIDAPFEHYISLTYRAQDLIEHVFYQQKTARHNLTRGPPSFS